MAFIGLGFLTTDGGGGLNLGDMLVFVCAVSVALHIILINRLGHEADVSVLNFIQSGIIGLVALIASLIFEAPAMPSLPFDFATLLITSLLATVVAFNVQIYAQRFIPPSRVAVILTGEQIFAAVFGYLLLSEIFGPSQFIGAALIFAGIITSEYMSLRFKVLQPLYFILTSF
ncbi:MAG: DMT family transporter [Actinomycetota bacterium]|nr:DMT family transporter [Actinomycetota bacterium]